MHWWLVTALLTPLPPSQQYLNQFENCCGLREGAILTLLSDIGKPQPRMSGRARQGGALRGRRGGDRSAVSAEVGWQGQTVAGAGDGSVDRA